MVSCRKIPTNKICIIELFYCGELVVLLWKAKTKFLQIATSITNYDRTSRLFPNGRSGIYSAHSRTAAGTDQIPY